MTTVRRACLEDYPGIARLMMQLQAQNAAIRPNRFRSARPKYTVEEFAATLQRPDHTWFAAVNTEGCIQGYAYCVRFEWETSANLVANTILGVDELCVDSACRRQGIGTLLLDAAKALAAQVGASSLELQVWEANEAAFRFFERYGLHTQRRRLELPL